MTTQISLTRLLAATWLVAAGGTAAGQEGFPLDGTWRAQLDDDRTVVLVMKWDGERINGLINPGPRSIDFTSAVLVPSDWGVRIEAETAAGDEIRISGTLVDIGSYNRRILGTWTEGSVTSELDLQRE